MSASPATGGHAQILLRLPGHGRELALVVFVARHLAGHDHARLFVGHGLGVVGIAVLTAQLHAAGFRFHRVVMGAPVGGQLGQPGFDLLAQRFALGQAGGQVHAGRGRGQVRVLRDDFQFGVVEGGVERGQELFHLRLVPAGGPAGGGLDFGAVERLHGQADRARAHGQQAG